MGNIYVEEILRKHSYDSSALIGILQDIQEKYNYLPEDSLKYTAERLDIPLSQVYSTGSFFKAFSLEPRGKHIITVCMGTACHVRGAVRVLDTISRRIGIESDQTTEDGNYTLERVNCLGCCAIGPIVVVDEKYYGEVKSTNINRILKKYDKEN